MTTEFKLPRLLALVLVCATIGYLSAAIWSSVGLSLEHRFARANHAFWYADCKL